MSGVGSGGSRWTLVALGALGLVAASAGACARAVCPLGDPDRGARGECRATLTLDHEDSPLAELRRLGGWRDEFQPRFPAAVIDPAAQRPVSAAASLQLDGRPIAWFSPPLDAVVLDGAAFAPLRRVDPTRASPGQRMAVGRVTPRAREALGDRGVVELLLRVGAIGTYWHLGADLCLQAEERVRGEYRATWRGVHQYVAQGRREARYGFVVEIDAEGAVVVIATGEG